MPPNMRPEPAVCHHFRPLTPGVRPRVLDLSTVTAVVEIRPRTTPHLTAGTSNIWLRVDQASFAASASERVVGAFGL
jgi:hypothetical protein